MSGSLSDLGNLERSFEDLSSPEYELTFLILILSRALRVIENIIEIDVEGEYLGKVGINDFKSYSRGDQTYLSIKFCHFLRGLKLYAENEVLWNDEAMYPLDLEYWTDIIYLYRSRKMRLLKTIEDRKKTFVLWLERCLFNVKKLSG
jgi:hypothetical protein